MGSRDLGRASSINGRWSGVPDCGRGLERSNINIDFSGRTKQGPPPQFVDAKVDMPGEEESMVMAAGFLGRFFSHQTSLLRVRYLCTASPQSIVQKITSHSVLSIASWETPTVQTTSSKNLQVGPCGFAAGVEHCFFFSPSASPMIWIRNGQGQFPIPARLCFALFWR